MEENDKSKNMQQGNEVARQPDGVVGATADEKHNDVSQPGKDEKKPQPARDEKKAAALPAVKEERRGQAKPREDKRGRKIVANNLREYRLEQMMSKAELARKAGLSVLTIDRIENGYGCRMDTKRKILKALGFKLNDRHKVFKEE
jgi:DNA-binding XRE family transcriptional regulator